MPNRPSRRTLVRWNDDHDKELLLWIVYCCNEAGIKIPFARIAQCMGAAFTEGACIQHLAKIRNKMDEAGLHVPPSQKRGTATRTGSSIYAKKSKQVSFTRPNTAPMPRIGDFVDDEDEEFEEDLTAIKRPAGSTAGKKSTYRRGHATKTNDPYCTSDEDDPIPSGSMPDLYDSDNEWGAKKIPTPEKNKTPNSQVTLNFGGPSKNQATEKSQDQSQWTIGQPAVDHNHEHNEHRSPTIKQETEEDRMTSIISPIPTQTRGLRRKLSDVFMEDDDDEDWVESDQAKVSRSRGKKSRATRPPKKPKLAKISRGVANKNNNVGPAAAAGYQEPSYHADRVAMPPPPPALSSTRPNMWNQRFMTQPFASAGSYRVDTAGVENNDGGWNDFSASANSLDPSQNPFFGNYPARPFQQPSYHHSALAQPNAASPSATRNNSFASASSTSTVETQPESWNQPTRSSYFPNPQEASMVLNTMFDLPLGSDLSTHVNIFEPPMNDPYLTAPIGDVMMTTPKNDQSDDYNINFNVEEDSLFVGTSDQFGLDTFNFTNYLELNE